MKNGQNNNNIKISAFAVVADGGIGEIAAAKRMGHRE